MTVLKDYWVVTSSQQQELRQLVYGLELEEYARQHQLIVYRGKVIKPEDYPCGCELQDPLQCQLDPDLQMGVNDKTCVCLCHMYFEPY